MPDSLDLRQRIASLSVEQRAELERRLLDSQPQDRARAGIPRRGPGGRWPMSFGQQRLWVLHQLEPGLLAYNMPRATRLEGPLDVDALRRSLDALVERHEALRTTFATVGGEPVQVVGRPRAVELPLVDLSALGPGSRAAALDGQLRDEVQAPFDLGRDLMVRGRLVRLAPDDHVLALTFHHIASDGLSGSIFDRELGALYTAFTAGRPSPLAPLPIQYADYAVWQRRWFEGAATDQLRHWRERLAGAPPVLELPTDRPRPAATSYRGGRHLERLPTDLVAAVAAFGRRHRATPFMAFLAMLHALLARYSGQRDVVLGTAIAGRTRVELEGLIGFFVNTLVLRTDLAGDPTAAEIVERTRQTAIAAYGHQEMPFERLVQELNPERLLDRSPLIQVSFVMQEAARASLAMPGVVATPTTVPGETAPFDLSLSLVPDAEGIAIRTSYNADVFEPETIAQMLGHYRMLLERAGADPACRLSALPLVSEPERERLRAWSCVPGDPGPEPAEALHRLVERQVARTPDAPAVVAPDGALTYAEFDARANRLARHLRGLGVGPDSVVAVAMERSLDLAVGLLAVLKAGAAYLPLDPEDPPARVAATIEDSRAAVVLTRRELLGALPAAGIRCVCVDAERDAIAAHPATAPPGDVAPGAAAYVIFTSGSTGRPKGVVVEHGAIVSHMRWMAEAFPLTAADAVLQKTAASFDASVWEFWAPLLQGARLVLASPGILREPRRLVAELADRRITVLQVVPPLLRLLLDEPGLARCEALRRVFCGGEALPADLVARVHATLGAELVNLYGPTEVTIDSTFWRCERGRALSPVPIGRPVDRVTAWVLDDGGRLAPIGVPGELHLGGAGVARGYLRRPDLTAERFVPDPHGARPGARLYRTGDLVRWRRDGSLEYLGRRDRQVKIRGHRIELGEIETALCRHPAVHEAVVLAQDAAENRRLVAYVVASGSALPDVGELRAALQGMLPAPMIPAAFLWVDAMPLTPSGKVDRRALERLGGTAADPATAHAPPRTALERGVAAIWAEVLQVDRVGVHDNFFELGGHSLSAVRVLTRLADEYGVTLPLRRLFEAPTVAELAVAVAPSAGAGPRPQPTAPSDAAPGPGDPLPLSHFQEQFWLINQEDPTDPTYNGCHPVRLRGPLSVSALRTALGQLVERHDVLRTVFALVDGEPRQMVGAPAPFELPVVDLRGHPDPEGECRRLIEEEARRPFDLGRDCMLRARLLRLGERDHVLVPVMHHIASDAWSTPIVWRDLGALYEAARAGRPAALPPLAIQYAEFASWQRDRLAGPVLDAHLDYWRRRLAGAPATLDLPTDRPRRATRSRGRMLSRPLPAELSGALRSLGARAGTTPFMTLLAGYAALLHRYTGAEDIVIGAPALGREREEARRLIGCFVNMIALRVDLGGDPSFRELLARVRASALEAYDHKDAPFPKVVEALRPARLPGRSPVFQVVLNMRDFGAGGLRLDGLECEPVPRPELGAMFDLMLYHQDAADGAICLSLQYATDLFDPETVQRLLGHLETLLASAVADPERPLSRLALLTGAERRALAAWSGGERRADAAGGVHALFEAQADLRPEAPALIHAGRVLSYGEVEARANRLAHHLRALGAGPDVPVGLCVERSLDMAVAVLGILKAGAGYVPLDPSYPPARLTFMIDAVGLPIVVTHGATTDRLPAPPAGGAAPRVVCLDRDAGAIAAQAATRPPSVAGPGHLLYVLFTSGSSGRPKGVAMSHGPLVNLMRWQHERSGCGVGARTLQFAPYSFDVSCQELFATLGAGGTLVVVDDDTRLDPEALLEVVSRERVARVFMPFVALEQLAQAAVARDRAPAALREVVTAGEQLRVTPAIVALFRRLPGARLDNQYGPTECHVVSAQMLDGPPEGWPALPAIGRPVTNARLHVLGPGGAPQPVGVAGELWVGGVPLARGYVGRPELTAERFVADHVGGAPGALLYRTGDLARWTADGRLEFLGRVDQQVKLRGYRVEPGEIEATLRRHPAVHDAVVLAQGPPGDRRLVAFLVAGAEARPDVAELQSALRVDLPAHMVPAAFRWIEDLPLTANGKIDRRAVERLGGTPAEPAAGYVAPRSPLEESVAAVWAGLLATGRVGVHDNFFDLGGHSLLAVRLAVRLSEEFGVRLTVRTLFEQATVAGAAARIARELAGLAHDSEAALAELEGLTDEEAERLLLDVSAGEDDGEPRR